MATATPKVPSSDAPKPLPPRRRREIPPHLRFFRRVRDVLEIPRETRTTLGWDILAGMCAGAYTGLAFPFFTRIARGDLHAPENAIAIMAAAPFVGNLLSPIWARQMEGKSKMPFVLFSWIPARFLLVLMMFVGGNLLAPIWAPFVILVFFLQFIGTIASPAYTSIMREIYPDRARGRLMGYVRVGSQSLAFFSTMIGGRLLDHHLTYRHLFPVAGIMGIMAALCFSRVRPLPAAIEREKLREKRTHVSTAAFVHETLSILKEHPAYRWFVLSVFTFGFGNLMVVPLYALYQVDVMKIANTQIANLANVASLAAIAGYFIWGRYMDKHGAPQATVWGIALTMVTALVYLISPQLWTLFLASAFFAFGQACIELAYMQSTLTYATPGREAQYQAVHSFLLGLRGVIAPLVGVPIMKTFGYSTAFAIAAGIMTLGAVLQWFATRTGER